MESYQKLLIYIERAYKSVEFSHMNQAKAIRDFINEAQHFLSRCVNSWYLGLGLCHIAAKPSD